MSTGTTLVAVKQQLKTLLTARPGLSGVQVSFARPTTGLLSEAIWFDTAAPDEADTAISVMGGAVKKVDETYTFTTVVQVLLTDGRDEETADLRAVALLAELQQTVAAAPVAIGAIRLLQMAGWVHTVGPLGEGTSKGARFDVALRVNALLQP